MNVPIRHMIDPSQQPIDGSLLARLQKEVETLLNEKMTSQGDRTLVPLWSSRAASALQNLVRPDSSFDFEALGNFRRDQILVEDLPNWKFARNFIKNNFVKNSLGGYRRATKKCLVECLKVLQKHGYEHLLRKYPSNRVGNPDVFNYRGHQYTFRWTRHVYFLGLMNKVLGSRLNRDFVVLDIGSSYGIFSSLVKKEYPTSHHILVDLPEQLILAYYFLSSCFPDARIAGVNELLHKSSITKDFALDYDFVLVPTSLFGKLSPNFVDLVTNFASLGEMRREYFNLYLQSDVFLSSKYFYMINRIEAYPEDFGTDVSILDYPIWDNRKKLHFGICPIFSVHYLFRRRFLFFSLRQLVPPPYFEYIGQI